ncbi:MAG TPA: hypothetical protein VHK00_01290 [Miltoncostaeaceae bacterium]|nr:hypothetical protein [Miltoncostaeaceae bacterium]
MALVDDVRDYAQRVSDAAKKGVSTARNKGQGVNLKRKQSALAADLGRIVFRQREGETGLDAEIDRLVSEMRGVRAEIEALDEA